MSEMANANCLTAESPRGGVNAAGGNRWEKGRFPGGRIGRNGWGWRRIPIYFRTHYCSKQQKAGFSPGLLLENNFNFSIVERGAADIRLTTHTVTAFCFQRRG